MSRKSCCVFRCRTTSMDFWRRTEILWATVSWSVCGTLKPHWSTSYSHRYLTLVSLKSGATVSLIHTVYRSSMHALYLHNENWFVSECYNVLWSVWYVFCIQPRFGLQAAKFTHRIFLPPTWSKAYGKQLWDSVARGIMIWNCFETGRLRAYSM